jgi:hypothetical protein
MTSELRPRRRLSGRALVGGFYLVTGGTHLGIVVADTGFYRHFADRAQFAFVRSGWTDIVMAHPACYGLLLMAGEIALGSALLVGGRAARVGWAGVVVFHLLLLLFGWGFLWWVIPALGMIAALAWHDRRDEERSLARS